MPARKGSKLKRRPQRFRTRKDGLHINIQKQLLIDLESQTFAADVPPGLIVESRPELYGDPSKPEDAKLVKSCSDKIRRLRELKVKDPQEYW